MKSELTLFAAPTLFPWNKIFMNERRKLEDCINLNALDHKKKLFGYFLVVFIAKYRIWMGCMLDNIVLSRRT